MPSAPPTQCSSALNSSATNTIARGIKRYRCRSPTPCPSPSCKKTDTRIRTYQKHPGKSYTHQEKVVHNYSKTSLSKDIISLLNLGLSFTPTPYTNTDGFKIHLLQAFDLFAKNIRWLVTNNKPTRNDPNREVTQHPVIKPLKFLPKNQYDLPRCQRLGQEEVEEYIVSTKQSIRQNLPMIVEPPPKKPLTESSYGHSIHQTDGCRGKTC